MEWDKVFSEFNKIPTHELLNKLEKGDLQLCEGNAIVTILLRRFDSIIKRISLEGKDTDKDLDTYEDVE